MRMKAHQNQEFLESVEARILRVMSEYMYPLKVFREEQVTDTVVVFGSSRIPDPGRPSEGPAAPYARYYREASDLCAGITRWNKEIASPRGKHYLICTGGGPGIMEAANRGADEAGGESMGLNITIPAEQHYNPYISERFRFEFQYFFMRKFWFLYYARVLVVFPGGYGTMDELFETLTLQQTEVIKNRIPVILYGRSFWEQAVNFEFLAEAGMIGREHLDLFSVVDSVDEALDRVLPVLESHLDDPLQGDDAPSP